MTDPVMQFIAERIREKKSPIHLTNAEYAMLVVLIAHEGKTFSRVELLKKLGKSFVRHNITKVIRCLREKFEENPEEPRYLRTILGRGVQFSRAIG